MMTPRPLTRRLLTLYRRSLLGAVAITFGLSLPVMIAAVGVAVDGSRGWLVKQRLTSALDAAALAAAAQASNDPDDILETVEAYLEANYPDDRIGQTRDVQINLDVETSTLTVAARADVETMFMGLFGFDTLNVGADVEVKRVNMTNIELAMVLDITGSMAGNRIVALRQAARDMVDIIVSNRQDIVYSKIALVPYSMGVNVGSYANAVRGTVSSGTCTTPGCQSYRFTNMSNQTRTHQISTCVTERTGAEAYTDAPPNANTRRVGRNYPTSANPCPNAQIVPLTSDKTLLRNRINALQAGGSTAGHIGTAWGWYMLSENFGYLWPNDENRPAPYGAENTFKIVVIMTDGEYNTPYCNGVIARNATDGSGSNTDKINCNATNGNAYTQAYNLCQAMKDEGIIVYTVGFDIGNSQQVLNIMTDCATDPSHAYLANNNTELISAFQRIAGDIMSVYVSK